MTKKSKVTEYSLGYAHNLVKQEIFKICDLTIKQKQLKTFNKTCCEKIVEQHFTYGCKPSYTNKKNSKKYSQRIASKYKFKRNKKAFKPGKYVRKKKYFTNRKKLCLKGKKNCRCWVCNEEWHYANKCPNRKQHQDKIKMFEELILLGMKPVEDEYEGLEEVMIIEIDPGEESTEPEYDTDSSS